MPTRFLRPLSTAGSARRPGGGRGGVALIMVLCALFLLSIVVFGLAERLNQQLFFTRRDNLALEAKALAYSGLQIALHPQATIKTQTLRRQVDATHRYAARIVGEGGKINLNWLIAGEDPRKLGILKSYLVSKGLDVQQTEVFVDCLLDWVDPDNIPHLNGDETGLDGLPAPNRPLQDLSEIRRIRGSPPLVAMPHWDRDFTLLSQGPIDLQWASEDIIAALPNVGQLRARAFIQQRQGDDQIDGTADDRIIQNVQMAAQLLGIAPNDLQQIQDLVVVNDPTTRIISLGQAADITKTFEVVVRKQGMQPQFLLWKEY